MVPLLSKSVHIYNSHTLILTLNPPQSPKLEVKDSKERGIYVQGLGQHVVTGMQDMMRKLQVGAMGIMKPPKWMQASVSYNHIFVFLCMIFVLIAAGKT